MKFVAFGACGAALLGMANAACPNQCSGHGMCNEVDRCQCFSRVGTSRGELEGWTGADCSLRTCPAGVGHGALATGTNSISSPKGVAGFTPGPGQEANSKHALEVFVSNEVLSTNDVAVDLEVASVSGSQHDLTVIFKYKMADAPYYGLPVTARWDQDDSTANAYSSAATAHNIRPLGTDTGLYVYFNLDGVLPAEINQYDHYAINVTRNEGMQWLMTEDNSAHQMVECSGHGQCMRATGSCSCSYGFDGDACQRILPWKLSGVGTSIKQVASDADDAAGNIGIDYNDAWDSDLSLIQVCDSGNFGPHCRFRECPSGADPMGGFDADGNAAATNTAGPHMPCSGRGRCHNGVGRCFCNRGFHGAACEMIKNPQ